MCGKGKALSLLEHIDSNHYRIITGNQVEMEYKKNRQRIILESLHLLKMPEWGDLKSPAFLPHAKPGKAIERKKKEIAQHSSKLKRQIEGVLKEPLDIIDKMADLIQSAFIIAVLAEIVFFLFNRPDVSFGIAVLFGLTYLGHRDLHLVGLLHLHVIRSALLQALIRMVVFWTAMLQCPMQSGWRFTAWRTLTESVASERMALRPRPGLMRNPCMPSAL